MLSARVSDQLSLSRPSMDILLSRLELSKVLTSPEFSLLLGGLWLYLLAASLSTDHFIPSISTVLIVLLPPFPLI